MFTLRLLGGASLEGPDGPVSGRAALRHRIALLARLAVEHPRPVSRDKLVADLWPESETADARHLLRGSLYILRSALGEDAVLGTGDDLRLNPERLTCDLWEFETALARGDPEQAVSVYHGPFLSGFHLSEAEEFERWVDAQRSRLGGRHAQGLEELAERETRRGDSLRATKWWSRLAAEDPYNSRIALRYMQALEAAGDRAGALRHATAHSELLRADLDAAPEREVVALAERLRRESRPATGGEPGPAQRASAAPAPLEGHPSEPVLAPVSADPDRPQRRRWLAPVIFTLAALLGLGVLGGTLSRERSPVLTPRRVAAAPFENRTGRPDLDDLGALAADWIIRGMMDMPLIGPEELQAVYSRGMDREHPADMLTRARRDSARLLVQGGYYLSGDSVLFHPSVMDVASGRILRSLDPVGAPIERATDALELLRERMAGGLSALLSPLNKGTPVDPDLVPPSLPAYREFVAGLKETWHDWGAAAEHHRRAATLDTTFIAPLIQLAFFSSWEDECAVTDSIAVVLEPRRARLTVWDRMTIDLSRAFCRGDVAGALNLLDLRLAAYPRSSSGKNHYQLALQAANRPRAARRLLLQMDPRRDLMWRSSSEEVWPRYWGRMADTWHMLGGYHHELDITDRWRDTMAGEWQEVRGRALAALGRDDEVLELLGASGGALGEWFVGHELDMAAELAAHGHPETARQIAEGVLAQLELEPDTGWIVASRIGANRLLSRSDEERAALEQVARDHVDTVAQLDALARIAVLLSDTGQADSIDSALAARIGLPLMSPRQRGELIFMRAQIAAGLGRREQAVAILRDASARGLVSSHDCHADLELLPLRGYPPFEALLRPED